jgi:sulfite exporter TauE/SafE
MVADCLHGLLALGEDGLAMLLGSMLLAGLAGGATHCAGMCGPFVMAQAAAGAGASGGTLCRLAGAALLPYQAGRVLGYAAFGAVAGGAAGTITALVSKELLALPLGLAAAAMLAQALSRWSGLRLPGPRFMPAAPVRLAGRLLGGPPGPLRGFALGLMLSSLPCGLLYGALAAAAASGSALAGALSMLAFVLGTIPALTAVALLGRFFARRLGPGLRTASALALLVNAALLAALALRVAAGVA